MITCKACTSENFFIEFSGITEDEEGIVNRMPMKATCRSCGGKEFNNFFLSALPKQAAIEHAATPELKERFFWYDDKQPQQKYCILFNIWQFQRFAVVEQAPDEDQNIMILEASGLMYAAGKAIMPTEEDKAFRGLILLYKEGNLIGKAIQTGCKKLKGEGLKEYPEAIEVPAEDPFMMANDNGFRRLFKYAYTFTEIELFKTPIAYKYGLGFLRGNLNQII